MAACGSSPGGRRMPGCRDRTKDSWGLDISPKSSARCAGELQCLGDMPWVSRATATWPDNRYVASDGGSVNAGPRFSTPLLPVFSAPNDLASRGGGSIILPWGNSRLPVRRFPSKLCAYSLWREHCAWMEQISQSYSLIFVAVRRRARLHPNVRRLHRLSRMSFQSAARPKLNMTIGGRTYAYSYRNPTRRLDLHRRVGTCAGATS